jgi:hypothetical protein
MRAVPRSVKVVSFTALLAAGPGSFGLYAMPGKDDPGTTVGGSEAQAHRKSARQLRLEEDRNKREETRIHRHEEREKRLEAKRDRLQEALEKARDAVQIAFLNATDRGYRPRASGSRSSCRRRSIGMGCLSLLASAHFAPGKDGIIAADAAPSAVLGAITSETDAYLNSLPVGTEAQPAPGSPEALTDYLMAQIASDEINTKSAMVQRALQAQRTMLQSALGTANQLAAPPSAGTPAAQLIQNSFQIALSRTKYNMNNVLPLEFGPIPGRQAPNPAVPATEAGGVLWCPEVIAAKANLDAAKRDVVAAIRQAKSVGSDIVIAALSLISYGSLGAAGYGVEIGSSVTSIFISSPISPGAVATGSILATASGLFAAAYASDAVAGAVTVDKFREPQIDALNALADAEDAWQEAYKTYMATVRRAMYYCPPVNVTQEAAGTSAPAPAATPSRPHLAGELGAWGAGLGRRGSHQ